MIKKLRDISWTIRNSKKVNFVCWNIYICIYNCKRTTHTGILHDLKMKRSWDITFLWKNFPYHLKPHLGKNVAHIVNLYLCIGRESCVYRGKFTAGFTEIITIKNGAISEVNSKLPSCRENPRDDTVLNR